jgi:hypothetical protein
MAIKNAGGTRTRFNVFNAQFRKIRADDFHIEMKISGSQWITKKVSNRDMQNFDRLRWHNRNEGAEIAQQRFKLPSFQV